jgi:predicted amidohydrolase
VQLDIAWQSKDANFERVLRLLAPADVRPGDLILLPEMFDTGFSFNVDETSDTDGRTFAFLQRLAQDTGAVVQGGRTIPTAQGSARNVMAVVSGDTVLAEYAKIKLFSPGGEHGRFEPGRAVRTYPWAGATVMPAICYDLRFPELFRAALARGAEVIALGACWPSVRQAHWRALLIARAIENQCAVLGVNRVGDDPPKTTLGVGLTPGLHYTGGTIAVNAKGEVLGELGDREGVLSVPLDIAAVREWRERFPAWKDAGL